MGEIADDMINGACCLLCGIYFEKEHGYPVVCKECAKGEDLEEAELQIAIYDEISP